MGTIQRTPLRHPTSGPLSLWNGHYVYVRCQCILIANIRVFRGSTPLGISHSSFEASSHRIMSVYSRFLWLHAWGSICQLLHVDCYEPFVIPLCLRYINLLNHPYLGLVSFLLYARRLECSLPILAHIYCRGRLSALPFLAFYLDH